MNDVNHCVSRMNGGVWTPASRSEYNLRDAVSRCTTQVRQVQNSSPVFE